jgi:hypothetical protein
MRFCQPRREAGRQGHGISLEPGLDAVALLAPTLELGPVLLLLAKAGVVECHRSDALGRRDLVKRLEHLGLGQRELLQLDLCESGKGVMPDSARRLFVN